MRKGPDWNHYTYVYGEERQARVAFDVEAAVLPTDQALQGLRLRFPEDADALGLAGEALPGREPWLVGELRYAGVVELVVQVPAGFDLTGPLARLKEAGATVERTSGWDYFDDRISPTPADWRRIEDREALERLDLDGDGELRILHRFYGDADALSAVRARLEPEGFTPVQDDDQRITLAHVHPIGDVSRITLGLLRLCEKHGVAYDGWALPG